MGSEFKSNKPLHYDITMSKRTRKTPSNLEKSVNNCALIGCFPERENSRKVANAEEEIEVNSFAGVNEHQGGEENDKKVSLKALIGGKNISLSQHFTKEEKQLQLVVKQPKEGLEFKKMAVRCAKILGRMIKIKPDTSFGSQKKRAPRLTT